MDEALSSLLKAEQKAAKARRGAPAAEEDGRKRKRRREDSEDTDSAHQVALLCGFSVAPSITCQAGLQSCRDSWNQSSLGQIRGCNFAASSRQLEFRLPVCI